MPDQTTSKNFTISLDTGNYETLCALAQVKRLPLSFQHGISLAVQRFADEYEGHAVTLVLADGTMWRSKP